MPAKTRWNGDRREAHITNSAIRGAGLPATGNRSYRPPKRYPGGLLFDDADPFDALMARCADIAAHANSAAKQKAERIGGI